MMNWKVLERSGSGVMEILSQHLRGETEETREEPQPRQMVSKTRLKPSKFQVRVKKRSFVPGVGEHFWVLPQNIFVYNDITPKTWKWGKTN
jgi:hypothetical protein